MGSTSLSTAQQARANGRRMKEIRSNAGLSQSQLGLRIGKSISNVSDLENGLRDPAGLRLDTAHDMAIALGMSMEDMAIAMLDVAPWKSDAGAACQSIAERRKQLGMKQPDLGAACGTNAVVVSRWERGRVNPLGITLRRAIAMAKALRVPLDDLYAMLSPKEVNNGNN